MMTLALIVGIGFVIVGIGLTILILQPVRTPAPTPRSPSRMPTPETVEGSPFQFVELNLDAIKSGTIECDRIVSVDLTRETTGVVRDVAEPLSEDADE